MKIILQNEVSNRVTGLNLGRNQQTSRYVG